MPDNNIRISPIAEVFEKFLEFEEAEHLHLLRWRNLKIWDYIRYHMFYEIAQYSNHPETDIKKRSATDRLIEFAKSFINYLADIIKCSGKRYSTIFFNTTERTMLIDGKMVNPYNYPVIKSLVSIAREGDGILLIDETGSDVKPQNYPSDILRPRWADILGKTTITLKEFLSPDKQIAEMAEDIAQKVEKHFRLKIDVYKIIRKYFMYSIARKKRYLKLFKKFGTRTIIFADNGNMKGIIEAAKELGIISIDTQHSLLSDLNILYRYKPSVPQEDRICSDYFFSFGDYWHRYMANYGTKLIPVGFPYFDIEYKRALESPKTACNKNNNRNIIIISGGCYLRDVLIDITLGLSRILPPEYHIYYKLRVEEYARWRDFYPPEFSRIKNMTIIDNNDISLYEYFAISSYQVGSNSGAIYEGLAFNLTTFIIKYGFYEEMKPLYEEGENKVAYLVETAEEISEIILRDKPADITSSTQIRDKFFKKNSISNFLEALNSITSR